MPSNYYDLDRLRADLYVKVQVGNGERSWKKVEAARLAGLTNSTFCKLFSPDGNHSFSIGTLEAAARFASNGRLGVSHYVRAAGPALRVEPAEGQMDAIRRIIREDPNLSDEARADLIELMSAAYGILTREGRTRCT